MLTSIHRLRATVTALAMGLALSSISIGTAAAEGQRPPGTRTPHTVVVTLAYIHVDSDGDGGVKSNCGEIWDSQIVLAKFVPNTPTEFADAAGVDHGGKKRSWGQKYCSGDTYAGKRLQVQGWNQLHAIVRAGDTLELRARFSEHDIRGTLNPSEVTRSDSRGPDGYDASSTNATGLATVKAPAPGSAVNAVMTVLGYGGAGHVRMTYTFTVHTLDH